MNKNGITLLAIAIIFTMVGGIIINNIDAPIVLGLFYGLLPRREFRMLLAINLIMLVPGLINTQVLASSYLNPIISLEKIILPNNYPRINLINNSTGINSINNSTGIKINNSTVINSGNNSTVINSGNNSTVINSDPITGFVQAIYYLPITIGNYFPRPFNLIGEFLGAGIFSLIMFFLIIIAIIGSGVVLATSAIYLGIYFIFKNLIFTYLPSNPIQVGYGAYVNEYIAILATTANILTVILFFGTIFITYWLLKRIGFYKRVTAILGERVR